MRFYDDREQGTWKQLLIEKYTITCDSRIRSALWNDILKVRPVMQVSSNWQVSNGHTVRFLLDR